MQVGSFEIAPEDVRLTHLSPSELASTMYLDRNLTARECILVNAIDEMLEDRASDLEDRAVQVAELNTALEEAESALYDEQQHAEALERRVAELEAQVGASFSEHD